MSRRMYARTLNGESSSTWRYGAAQSATLGVNVATFGATGILGMHVHFCNCAHGYTNILPFRFRAGVQSGARQIRAMGDGTVGQNY